MAIDPTARSEKRTKHKKTPSKRFYGFRLFESEVDDLRKLTGDAGEAMERNISEGHILRALIYIGINMSQDRLIKACKEVM